MLRHQCDAEPGQGEMLDVLLAVAEMAQPRRDLHRRAQLLQPRRRVAAAPAEQRLAVEGGKRDRVARRQAVPGGKGEPVTLLARSPAVEPLRRRRALLK